MPRKRHQPSSSSNNSNLLSKLIKDGSSLFHLVNPLHNKNINQQRNGRSTLKASSKVQVLSSAPSTEDEATVGRTTTNTSCASSSSTSSSSTTAPAGACQESTKTLYSSSPYSTSTTTSSLREDEEDDNESDKDPESLELVDPREASVVLLLDTGASVSSSAVSSASSSPIEEQDPPVALKDDKMPTHAILPLSSSCDLIADTKGRKQEESEEARRHRLLTQASARCRSTPAFQRFRPSFHVIAPYGWMNDPCAPCFRPAPTSASSDGVGKKGEYSVYFQWNPFGTEWGNMSWGGYVSRDLVHWQPVTQNEGTGKNASMTPSIMPEDERRYPADAKGVFSGCMVVGDSSSEIVQADTQAQQNQELTIVYTSVSSLPVHHTLPYTRGSEKVSLATSQDGGQTWERYNSGKPVLQGPPEEFDVTGWRDPFVGEWEEMAVLQGRNPKRGAAPPLYGILAGGIRGKTPTAFLYSIGQGAEAGDASNKLAKWQYVGTLLCPGLNRRLGTRTGDLGTNWEVCNFIQLARHHHSALSNGNANGNGNGNGHRAQDKQHYLILSAEATQQLDWLPKSNSQQQITNGTNATKKEMPERLKRRVMWIACDLEEQRETNELLRMQCCAALDYGCLYAVNSFWDPSTSQRILWGWIPEDDIGEEGRNAQGWAGCLSLPRELFEQATPNVVGSLFSETLQETGLVQCSAKREDGSMEVRSLGIRPAKQLASLRKGSLCHRVEAGKVLGLRNLLPIDKKLGATWELETTIDFGRDETDRIDLIIAHGSEHHTTISFDLATSILSVDRSHSHTSISEKLKINDDTEAGPLPLFRLRDLESGNTYLETLRLHIYFDKSVLEIFANERFAISTRIYSGIDQHAITLCSGNTPIRILDTRIHESLQQVFRAEESQD